jgi:3'-phosphoadenosine 5'-phosphosulfate sulfotransferase (PAPS reductase)/FAD synthetase
VSNPYLITGPAVVSFSGGRTSGYMLRHILDAHGGTLPPDVLVVFCNTGKERPETLDFVERCSAEWGVPVVWLEYTSTPREGERVKTRNGRLERPYVPAARVVNYATASRNGEPLERIIEDRRMLPNPVGRFCTVEGKILTLIRYLESLDWSGWTNVVGFRADEPERVRKLLAADRRHSDEDLAFPLHVAGATRADVIAFWAAHPFDLGLRDHEGNCDLCFLKGAGKIQRIMRDRPDLAAWWVEMETRIAGGRTGTGRFRSDRPGYATLLELSKRPTLFPVGEDDELSVACHCTD